jgi:hypothetical protein
MKRVSMAEHSSLRSAWTMPSVSWSGVKLATTGLWKSGNTQLVFGSIAFKLLNLGKMFWVVFHKLPTIIWVNFGPFLLTELL